jgi:hypothetical protein
VEFAVQANIFNRSSIAKKTPPFFLKLFMEIFAQITNFVYNGEKLLISLQKFLALLK